MVKPMRESNGISFSYLALGDSYTIGASVTPAESYPYQLCDSLSARYGTTNTGIKIIAQTGWNTSVLIDMEKNAQLADTYDLVSLLIGVNNQYQGRTPEEYHTQFRQLLETAIKRAGGRKDKVFVISIPDYGYTPFGQANQAHISAQIDIFNAINKEVTDSAGITYFDITPISRRGLSVPTLVASDGLHPSGEMYALWTQLMQEKVYAMLRKP